MSTDPIPRWEQRCRNELAVTFTPEGVEQYMHAPNRQLGGQSPRALIWAGEYERVWAVIGRLESGAW